jgi:hypothetical protein
MLACGSVGCCLDHWPHHINPADLLLTMPLYFHSEFSKIRFCMWHCRLSLTHHELLHQLLRNCGVC